MFSTRSFGSTQVLLVVPAYRTPSPKVWVTPHGFSSTRGRRRSSGCRRRKEYRREKKGRRRQVKKKKIEEKEEKKKESKLRMRRQTLTILTRTPPHALHPQKGHIYTWCGQLDPFHTGPANNTGTLWDSAKMHGRTYKPLICGNWQNVKQCMK